MATATVKYLGELRTECTHLASGSIIKTDAPVDNRGRGEMFSPTDMCATSLAACALSIMGMYADDNSIDVTGAIAEVTKVMSKDAPRRIVQIDVVITMPAKGYTDEQKKGFLAAVDNCPMHHSLRADIKQNFVFNWL